jgi:hypothetical protein
MYYEEGLNEGSSQKIEIGNFGFSRGGNFTLADD